MNEMVEAVDNPFANAPVAARPQSEAMVAVGSAREVAEVQAAMVMARRFPRVEVEVVDRILQACTRPTLAEGALYEYARGGTDIKGPSIRLAECIAQYWGHLDYGWRVLEERPGATKVQAFAWDMQTGTRCQMVFDVLHERMARGSRSTLQDPRDIYEHVANAASRRLRACILRVIPGDVVESAVKQCEVTLRTRVEVTPERLKSLTEQFAELGVSRPQIEKRIQRRLEAITPGMMVQLGRIFTSIRDGISQASEWFPEEVTGTSPEGAGATPRPTPATARQAVRTKLEQRRKAPEPAPEPEAHPVPPERLQTETKAPPPPKFSEAFADVVNFAKAATTKADLERAATIAMQLTDPDEAVLAQQHLDAARKRIAS